jgi:hypothetical protein
MHSYRLDHGAAPTRHSVATTQQFRVVSGAAGNDKSMILRRLLVGDHSTASGVGLAAASAARSRAFPPVRRARRRVSQVFPHPLRYFNMRTIVAAALALSAIAAPASAQQMIQNGGFELGLTSWNAYVWPGSMGNVYTSNSTTTPLSVLPAIGPKSGASYALTDMLGPGAYDLRQTFHLSAAATSAIFSFAMSIDNLAGVALIGADFNPFSGGSKQFVSVDLFAGTPSPFSTASLMNFYKGSTTSFGPNPYVTYTFDITSLLNAAGDYTIRFAEVDNQVEHNMAVDDVSLLVVATPEPASVVFVASGLLEILGVLRRRRSA